MAKMGDFGLDIGQHSPPFSFIVLVMAIFVDLLEETSLPAQDQ